MKKTIIAPVDFSATAANAARYATDLAVSVSAELILLHVLETQGGEAQTKQHAPQETYDTAFSKLNSLKETLVAHSAGKIHIAFEIEHGKVAPRIKDYCTKKGPFMVVMGMTSNFLLGSNSMDAMDHLKYPLIIVPGRAHFHPIESIGLALDKASVSDHHLQFLIILQQIFDAKVEVLYVNTDKAKASDPERFSFLRAELAGLRYEFHSITTHKLEEGMNKLLDDVQVDILVLIPKFHVFFEFHESQSKKLLLHSRVPVMAIHE